MLTKIILPFLAGVLVFVCGLYLGYSKSAKQSANVNVSATYDDSISIKLKNEVKLLKHLNDGEIDIAKDMLETLLDADVSYLGVKLLKTNTAEKNVLDALTEAKEYRQKYSAHKPNKAVSKTVEETFEKITKQP